MRTGRGVGRRMGRRMERIKMEWISEWEWLMRYHEEESWYQYLTVISRKQTRGFYEERKKERERRGRQESDRMRSCELNIWREFMVLMLCWRSVCLFKCWIEMEFCDSKKYTGLDMSRTKKEKHFISFRTLCEWRTESYKVFTRLRIVVVTTSGFVVSCYFWTAVWLCHHHNNKSEL